MKPVGSGRWVEGDKKGGKKEGRRGERDKQGMNMLTKVQPSKQYLLK